MKWLSMQMYNLLKHLFSGIFKIMFQENAEYLSYDIDKQASKVVFVVVSKFIVLQLKYEYYIHTPINNRVYL